jgi:hypothetical protein
MPMKIKRIRPEHLRVVLDTLGISHPKTGQRLDAGETALLAQQLEYAETTIYETKIAPAKATQYIPIDGTIPEGADSWSYNLWNGFGMAKIIHSYADDLPMVGRYATKYTGPIRSMGAAFGYSIQDIRAASFAGVPLSTDLGMQARRVIEMFTDEILAVGEETSGLPGFLNNTNITDVTLPTGTWASATSAQILADMHFLVDTVKDQSRDNFVADTFLFDDDSWNIVTSTPYSTTIPDTILDIFLKQKKTITNVDSWWRLNTAASGSPALIAYARTPEVVDGILPVPFEMMPPQAKGLGFHVPCHGRVGGCRLRYPIGAALTDDQ